MGSSCTRGKSTKAKICQPSSDQVTHSSSQIPINSVYNFYSKIGEGHFGVVHQARHSSIPGHEFAVKTIKKKNLSRSVHRVKIEIETLLSLDHPNIIKVYETFEDNEAIHIVMELCTGGEMMEIFPEDGSLPELQVLEFIRSMLKAVNHIHQMGIIHRDLKPENFLFSRSKNPDDLKLVDFGLSNKFTSKFEKLHSKVGTPYYVAPEVIEGTHNSKCDMWSVGVIFYIMLSGDIPFYAESVPAVFKKIMSGGYSLEHNPVWNDISEESKHLLSRLLCLNTHDRLSALEALMHPAIFSIPKPVKVNFDLIARLKKYSLFPLIKKCALAAIVKYMNFGEESWEKRIFLEHDLSLTGVVTPVEICDNLEKIQDDFSQFQINLLMDKVGIRSNGKLYFNEFIGCLLDSSTIITEEVTNLAFSFFDRERKGYFDCKNLMDAFRFLGRNIRYDEANKMIKEVGKAGLVKYKDFKNLIKNL